MQDKYDRKSPFRIMVNQVGYLPDGKKTAVLPFKAESFSIENTGGEVVFSGTVTHFGMDPLSGDDVYVADFTELDSVGTYRIVCGDNVSAAFDIAPDVYNKIFYDLQKAFYYLRCGCELKQEHAGMYVHKPCHTSAAYVWDHKEKKIDAPGGWHDAGDYGRYITAGACAVAHLLFAFKLYPQCFDKKSLNIPESGNGIPDILNECKYELEWFLKMQREDGAVYHKLSTLHHAAFVMPEDDPGELYAYPISSMATADFAAVCAMACGIYEKFDKGFSIRLHKAALCAYEWLCKNPEFVGFRNPQGTGTGEYGERDDFSNRYWAAAAMYSLTGREQYHLDMKRYMKMKFPLWHFGYGEVGGFGSLEYLISQQEKDSHLVDTLGQLLESEVDRLKELVGENGYGVAMGRNDFCWGSNMNVMKHGMTFGVADYLFGQKGIIRKGKISAGLVNLAMGQIDYLCGVNPLGICYVTGNGAFRCNYPHLRPAHTDGIEECIPGMVSGGPNMGLQDAVAKQVIPPGTPPMKCYADHVFAYSLNEITIYWNSPAVFTFAYVYGDLV